MIVTFILLPLGFGEISGIMNLPRISNNRALEHPGKHQPTPRLFTPQRLK